MISLVLMSSFRISAGDFSMRRQRFAYARLSHSYMTRLIRAFSVSFTTGPFGPSRIRLFEASPYRVGSEGPEYRSQSGRYSSFIFRTARCVSASSCHNHPQSLTEPCLTLSRHTARAIVGRHHPSAALSGSSRFRLAQRNYDGLLPSLQSHYRTFITTMKQSEPDWCICTFGLGLLPLRLFL